MRKNSKDNRGIALVLTMVVMSLLSVMALTFLTYMRVESKIILNYYYKILANYAAESGVEQTVAKLKVWSLNRAYYSGIGSVNDTYSFKAIRGDIDSFYSVSILDCASQININDSNPSLTSILENLPSMNNTLASNVVNNAPYRTKQEVMSVSGIGTATYEDIKDYITIFSWVNANVKDDTGTVTSRSPININSALNVQDPSDSQYAKVIRAALRPLLVNDSETNSLVDSYLRSTSVNACPTCLGNSYTVDNSYHPTWFNAAQNNTCPGICCADGSVGKPYKSYGEVDKALEMGQLNIPLTVAQLENLNDNINSNRTKPATYTTDFSFNSNGYFEIAVTGQVRSPNGILLSESKYKAVYHVFEIEHFTLKSQFEAANWRLFKVNARDGCPIDSTQDWNAGTHTTISDSVKLGFWDDFSDPAFDRWHASFGDTTTVVGGELVQGHSTQPDYYRTNLVGDSTYYSFAGNAYTYTSWGEYYKWVWEEFFCHAWLYDQDMPWENFPAGAPPYIWGGAMDWATWSAWETAHRQIVNFWWGTLTRNHWDVGLIDFGMLPGDVSRWAAPANMRMIYEIQDPIVEIPIGQYYLFPNIEIKFPGYPSGSHYFNLDPYVNGAWPYLISGPGGQGKGHKIDVCKTRTNGVTMGISVDSNPPGGGGGWIVDEMPVNNFATYNPGLISFHGEVRPLKADNLRIIPRAPYYIGATLIYAYLRSDLLPSGLTDTQTDELVERWGTISGNVTIPQSASEDSEFVFFSSSKDSYTANIRNTGGELADGMTSTRMQFQANFGSNMVPYNVASPTLSGWDNFTTPRFAFTETPVLEDVTITYLPRTEVVYWKKEY